MPERTAVVTMNRFETRRPRWQFTWCTVAPSTLLRQVAADFFQEQLEVELGAVGRLDAQDVPLRVDELDPAEVAHEELLRGAGLQADRELALREADRRPAAVLRVSLIEEQDAFLAVRV